jgi:hypothetical protein
MSKAVNLVKIEKESGMFDNIEFDEISLMSENRDHQNRPYEPPSSVIMRVTAQLDYLRDRENTLVALNQIKRAYPI